jgi:hypothetical protein
VDPNTGAEPAQLPLIRYCATEMGLSDDIAIGALNAIAVLDEAG